LQDNNNVTLKPEIRLSEHLHVQVREVSINLKKLQIIRSNNGLKVAKAALRRIRVFRTFLADAGKRGILDAVTLGCAFRICREKSKEFLWLISQEVPYGT
jgi:hypothetical protein